MNNILAGSFTAICSSSNDPPIEEKEDKCCGVNIEMSLKKWKRFISKLIDKYGEDAIGYISGGPHEGEFYIKQ